MVRDFNLLVTTSRGYENNARSELRYLLKEVGDTTPSVERTGISGLIEARTAMEPFVVIEKFRKILHERPYEFRYLLRIIPIEKVVQTSLEQIQQAAVEFGSEMGERETFRITLEKRFTQTHSKEIVEAAAAGIPRKVDLTDPDKILLIEVVGGLTGMSLVKPDQVLSVMKEKVL